MLHINLTQLSNSGKVKLFLNQMVSIEPHGGGNKVITTQGSYVISESFEEIDALILAARHEKPNYPYLKEA